MRSTKVSANIERGLWIEFGAPEDNYIACAGWTPPALDYPQRFRISYHREGMPAHTFQTFTTIEDLIVAMREIAPDLRKWKLAKVD